MQKLPIKEFVKFAQTKYHLTTSVFRRRYNSFETLIETILSQNTTDLNSGRAAEKLFAVANTPEKILKMETKELARLIYSAGYYNQKAKKIKSASKMILEKFNGKVPDKYEDLVSLPGVGDKTASVVLSFAFGKHYIPVDTHVAKVSKRLQYANEKDKPEIIRQKLESLVERKYYQPLHLGMILFGREICHKAKPKCYICKFVKYCNYKNKNLRKQ